jgi:hypothetical protein
MSARRYNFHSFFEEKVFVSSFKIQNFSSKHKLHRFDPPVYEIAGFEISQLVLKFFCYRFCYVNINWQILGRDISYTGGSKRCNLCLEEKFCILKEENKNCLLNKKMEINIISTCRHRKKFRVNNANNT